MLLDDAAPADVAVVVTGVNDGVDPVRPATALAARARLLASDGFHPGAPLYRQWGEAWAAHIADEVWPRR